MADDEALIRAAQEGDAEAFEALLDRYYDTLYRFAYKWCGTRADAEDVTQQACLKLARALNSYRFESAFSSWLYRVVINCAKDWARREGRHVAEELDADHGQELQQEPGVAADRGPEQMAYVGQLLKKLDALPEGIKETLLLVHGEGLTHSEAARVLEVKDSTVSWRLHEFRKRYRLSFDQGGLCD